MCPFACAPIRSISRVVFISIFADIKMIPRPVETTPTVAHFQIIFRKIPIYP